MNNQVTISADGTKMWMGDGVHWVAVHNKKLKQYIAQSMGFKSWQVKL